MSKFTQGEWKYLDELYQVCAYTDTDLKTQASTEKNDPLFMKALVAQDGAENIAKELLAYINGTEAQS